MKNIFKLHNVAICIEFAVDLFKTHAFSENLPFSICFLLGQWFAVNGNETLWKIKIQKNPAVKDWIIENKKNGRPISLIRKILLSSNGCKLMNYAHRFVKLRKYLYFQRFWKQRILFCSSERTFSPKQL